MHNFIMALSVKEQRAALGNISQPTYYKLLANDLLKTFKIGSRRFATPEALRDCIKKLEKDAE